MPSPQGAADHALLEDYSASFIVRIWHERGAGSRMSQEWRGSIEHVQSGRRSFFRDLRAIAGFMQPDLEALGIDGPLRFWDEMSSDLFEPAADTSAAAAIGRQPATAPAHGDGHADEGER